MVHCNLLESVKSCRLTPTAPYDSLHQTFLCLKVTSSSILPFPQDLHQSDQLLSVHPVSRAEAECEEQILPLLCQFVVVRVENVWTAGWNLDELLNLGHHTGQLTNLATGEVFSSVFPPPTELLKHPAASLVQSVSPGPLGLLVHVPGPGGGLRLRQGGVELH